MTLDELLEGIEDIAKYQVNHMQSNTRTYIADSVNAKRLESIDVRGLETCLREFNHNNATLFAVERNTLYNTFFIPKSSGGLRRIDAPLPPLMEALRQLKVILETNFHALYHTSAFAYVRGRCTIDALKRHQQNESKWFLKIDFADFFPSTSLDFLIRQLSVIFPFSEVVKSREGKMILERAMSLCFLDGSLPQGTPISPLLTNLLMIPIDHKISNSLRNFRNNSYVYTRYADDALISSKYSFKHELVCGFIKEVLNEFNAPYKINQKKTRYGSSAGSNWNLGLMLNKDNNITIGHQKKKRFKAMINNFASDTTKGIAWERNDVQELQGIISYYKMVEKSYIEHVLNTYSKKYRLNVRKAITDYLS